MRTTRVGPSPPLDAVPRLEARLLGGELPSAALQGWLVDLDPRQWYDGLATAVHLSFFVIPHAVAGWLLWRCPTLYRRYVLATALVFAAGLAGFVLLPTSPPWMTAGAAPETGQDPVHHIADVALLRLGLPLRADALAGQDQVLGFEPNPVAATPSIHLAVTALLALVLRRAGPGSPTPAWWPARSSTWGSTTSSTSRPALLLTGMAW